MNLQTYNINTTILLSSLTIPIRPTTPLVNEEKNQHAITLFGYSVLFYKARQSRAGVFSIMCCHRPCFQCKKKKLPSLPQQKTASTALPQHYITTTNNNTKTTNIPPVHHLHHNTTTSTINKRPPHTPTQHNTTNSTRDKGHYPCPVLNHLGEGECMGLSPALTRLSLVPHPRPRGL